MLLPLIAVRKHQKKCSQKVRAKCVGLTPPNWPDEAPNPPYMPTYEFQYNGETISVTRTIGKNDNSVEIGQEYELYIDPENPQNFVNSKDNNEQRGRAKYVITCFTLAVVMFIIYIITIFLTI